MNSVRIGKICSSPWPIFQITVSCLSFIMNSYFLWAYQGDFKHKELVLSMVRRFINGLTSCKSVNKTQQFTKWMYHVSALRSRQWRQQMNRWRTSSRYCKSSNNKSYCAENKGKKSNKEQRQHQLFHLETLHLVCQISWT